MGMGGWVPGGGVWWWYGGGYGVPVWGWYGVLAVLVGIGLYWAVLGCIGRYWAVLVGNWPISRLFGHFDGLLAILTLFQPF